MNGGDLDEGVVCTIGMHRSGTSLVSRMLNLLGLDLGPEERISAQGADNERGFWEHAAFVEINDRILRAFGGRWDEPPAFPPRWPCDPRLADLRAGARRLVDADFTGGRPWGWKDPRTCLTLPFWQQVVGPMRYVLCVRSPRAVMASLARRDGFSPEKAERLWLAHLQASLAHTSGQPRMVVFYEDVLDDWPAQLRRLAAFLGDPARAGDPRVCEAVGHFVDGALCHHGGSVEDVARDETVGMPALGLYVALRGRASSPDALDAIGTRALDTANRAAALAIERETLVREGHEQRAALAALGCALQEIHESRAWRFVTWWRRRAARLLPAGTRRRRALDTVLARLAP